jgi:hypothetical protein
MKKAAKEFTATTNPEAIPEENSVANDAPHPAELEANALRIELAEERYKTEALSRRCIRQGEALEALLRADDNRVEQNMFDHINGNSFQREAMDMADERRRRHFVDKQCRRLEREKKAAEANKKALKKSAVWLALSVTGGVAAVALGVAGYVHTTLATAAAGIALVAFGWCLNNCVSLLGRCK